MSSVDDGKELALRGFVVQQPLARKNVERLRRVHPRDTPHDVIRRLDRRYLAGVTVTGGVSGAVSMRPGAAVFAEASALYALSLAEVHGLHPEDFESRFYLAGTVVSAGGGVSVLDKIGEASVPSWSQRAVKAIPMSVVDRANDLVCRPRFFTKYGTKVGVVVLAEQLPHVIGAVFGATGNHVAARAAIAAARAVLGPPPLAWPEADG